MPNMPSSNAAERKPFHFGCETEVFPLAELDVLTQHGDRLEGLVSGAIAPSTPEDEHFLQVDREQAEPATIAERAWLRLKGRREFEREQRDFHPSAQNEDYGIIDWDREKCWW
jgi:uncharacterized protein YifE (UPF0438 family)